MRKASNSLNCKPSIKMKNILITIFIISGFLSYSQVPQGFSFQGIAFDDNGSPLSNKEVSIRANIIEGDINGPSIYTEEHNTNTSSQGLYSLIIGRGDALNSDFNEIDWSVLPKYISISISIDNEDFTTIGTTELMSVPYALVAGSIENTPSINVRWLNPKWTLPLDSTGRNSQARILYHYQWISGTPTNVLVDFTNGPSGITLGINETPGWGIPGLLRSYRNTSLIDTIRDGITPNQVIIGTDKENPPLAGYYEFPVYFRTEDDQLLDSLNLKLEITNFIEEGPFAECFEYFSGTKTAVSTDCEETEDLIDHEITFIPPTRSDEIDITNLLGQGKTNTITFSSCDFFFIDFYWSVSDPIYRSFNGLGLDDDGLYAKISVSTPLETKECEIRYE